MITLPNFLRELIESEAYSNKQHTDHQVTNQKVEHYMRMLYPGELVQDATGKFVAPEYDMTLEQFDAAQKQIDADFEDAKDEAEEEILDKSGEYFENLGISFDIDACVIPGESIPVKVLYKTDTITLRHLETYELDIPEFEKIRKIWVWHGETSETTCDECESLDGQLFYEEDDVPECPVHPNCRCWVEEIETDEEGNVINRTSFAGNPTTIPEEQSTDDTITPAYEAQGENMSADEKFETLISRVQGSEGGYENRPSRIDQETNMGITQETLNNYNRTHPDAGFPSTLRPLTWEQAAQIYREEYFDNKRIDEINDLRVAYAVMDMGVMTTPGNVANIVQSTINDVIGSGTVTQDRVIGTQTLNALNNVPAQRRDEFMRTLIQNRMEFLRGLPTWNQYSGGWTERTNGYIQDFN